MWASALGASAFAGAPEQGFFRVVEGDATLIRVEDGRPEAARENAPALDGDRVVLTAGSRVEIILADGHRLRLGRSAELELVALARSLGADDVATTLTLLGGALAVDVPRDVADRTRVDTAGAEVLLQRGGLYLLEIDDRGATRVVVRDGEAEVVTAGEATLVQPGEEAVVDATSRSRVALYQAPALTDVERWAEELEAAAARTDAQPLASDLRYAGSRLDRYGSWIDTTAGEAWRPRVESGWRPYWDGHWTYSPGGLVWTSYEPWGWVPYHYGQWDFHPVHGWLWYPGAVYAPAHVVWYWGSSYAAWVPAGYYRNFYARRFGFHLSFGAGFYGVSYAGWNAYRDWVFCPRSSLGYWNQHRFHRDHRVLVDDRHFDGGRRGFITADTGGLDARRWREPDAVENTLRQAHRRTGGVSEPPDLSAVIERSPEVSGTLLRDLDREDVGRRAARPVARPRTVPFEAPAATDVVPAPGVPAAHRSPRTPERDRSGVAPPVLTTRAAPPTAAAPERPELRAHRPAGLRAPASGVVDRAPGEAPDRARLSSTRTVDVLPARPVAARPASARPVAPRAPVDVDRSSPATRARPSIVSAPGYDGPVAVTRVRRPSDGPRVIDAPAATASPQRSVAAPRVTAPRVSSAAPGPRSAGTAGNAAARRASPPPEEARTTSAESSSGSGARSRGRSR
jgi:hypothetical protein